MPPLILALAAHFVGDFAFQHEWAAKEKYKSWLFNFYHAATYTAAFILFPTNLSLISLLIILATHFIIDATKTKLGVNIKSWQDQGMHLLVIIFVILLTR